jgi:hypothetical protein
MNKIRRFSAGPPTKGPFSEVPGFRDIMTNMNVIKKLLSKADEMKSVKVNLDSKETSKTEFVLGPVLTGIGGVTAAATALNQYLTKLPSTLTNRVTFMALCGLLIGILTMAKRPIKGIVGKFNVDGFQDLMKKRAVFTYTDGPVAIFDVGTFEEYLKNPDILPKAISRTLPQSKNFDEQFVGLTKDSAETLEKISIIVENVDRATVASLVSVAGLTLASGGIMKLIELSKGRDAADSKSRLKPQEYFKQRAKSIGTKNN